MRTVAFDANGTLFSMDAVREAMSSPAFEAWFNRTLHAAATVTFAGAYKPFAELAESSLRVEGGPPEALAAMKRLDPYPDAADALARLRDEGMRVVVLTNSARDSTERLLERGGLAEYVERVYSCDEVQAFKPSPAPYGLVGEGTLVAAHGWDVVGAQAAGLDAVWVDRLEHEWPFPGDPPKQRAGSLAEAVELLL
jgi:2-haloacid dehalogenase